MKKILLITFLISIYTLSFAQVQWQDDGVPVRQGENIVWNQTSVACDDETFVSVWTDTRNGVRGIYAQKVDENGNSLWEETGLEVYNPETIQSNPIAISSTNNSVIVCWQDYDAIEVYSSQIRVQKINANGDLLWGEEGILLEESGPYSYDVQIIKHNDGGLYIFWKETYQSDIKGIRLLADGSIAAGWEQGISLPAYFFDVHSDGLNGIIVASSLYDDIYLQRIDENGNKLWGYYGTLLFNGEDYIREIKVCLTITDEYYISWRSEAQSGWEKIRMQKADFTGNSIWEAPIIISEEGYIKRIMTICPSDSQPILVWLISNTIFSQKLDLDGNKLWGDEGIIVYESNYDLNKNSVNLKDDPVGGCIISWRDYDNSYNENRIIVQKIDENGDLLFEDGLIIFHSNESNDYNLYSSLAVNDQKYYLCWLDNTSDLPSLIHQIIDGDGNIYLEENGEEMYFGLSGFASDIQLLSNGDNPIMLWLENQNMNDSQIRFQILNDDGTNIFSENGIPITSDTQSDQEYLEAVYGENSETIAAVWSERRENTDQIFAQGIDTSGNYLWSSSSGVCLTSSDFSSDDPNISIVNNSGIDEYYIGWEDYSDFMNPVIYGQRIINGEKQWAENGIVISGESENCYMLDILDRFYIWKSIDYPNTGVKVKLIDEDGNSAVGWSDNGLHITGNSNYTNYIKFELIPTGLFISWIDNSEDTIYGQIVDYEGNLLWQEGGIPLIEGENINNFNVHYNDAFYIVWNEYIDGNYFNYYIQSFNENGETLWQEEGIRLSYWTQYTHCDPVIASVEQDVLVVWEHYFINQTTHIIAQLVSPDGELQYGLSGITICDQIMEQDYPQVYVNGTDAYICWRDGRSTMTGEEGLFSIYGIYTQKLYLEPTSADEELVEPIEILSNYPNPFNPETTISFSLSTENTETAEINIFNIRGQKIKTLPINQLTNSPINQVTWNGTDQNDHPVASGIYFYQLNIDKKVIASKKCLLLK